MAQPNCCSTQNALQVYENVQVELFKDNELIDKKSVKYGIKSISFEEEEVDRFKKFGIVLNGEKIFIKGVTLMPPKMHCRFTNVLRASHPLLAAWHRSVFLLVFDIQNRRTKFDPYFVCKS